MKKSWLSLLTLLPLTLSGCKFNYKVKSDFSYKDDSVVIIDNLTEVQNKKAHVVLLYGQSNADGVSHNEYLEAKDSVKYAEYLNGYENVLINFQNDGNGNSSERAFRKCALGCGWTENTFGPEMGIAETMSKAFPEDQTFIIKWTWGGTILHSQWLNGNRDRGNLYNSAMDFTLKCLSYLKNKGYELSLEGICWMQGESDACFKKEARLYYKNTVTFATLLRHDLKAYSSELKYIDAAINEENNIWPKAKKVNEAKHKFADESNLNIYIDTNALCLTSLQEPTEQVDAAHYDALSMVKLGQAFGQEIVRK